MYMGRILAGAAVLGCSMLVGKSALAQCQRDTDCKGARVCLGGQCVDRPAPAPAAAPAPMPAPLPAAPQPQPQPAYAPQPQPQPAYAPQPQPQPAYAPQPQPQPAYAPQPQPAYAQPGYPPAQPAAGGSAGLAVGGGVAAGAPAAAAPSLVPRLGVGTHFVFSADRLFGFHYWKATATQTTGPNGVPIVNAPENSVSGTQAGFLVGGSDTGYGNMPVNPYAIPRLGFDVALSGGFTIGGSLIYYATTGTASQTANGVTNSFDCPSISAVAVAGRAGFVVMFNDIVGIWPRLGFTVASSTTTTKNYANPLNVTEDKDATLLASADPEFLLVVTPVPHFGFLLGLQGSVGVAGKNVQQSAGVTVAETNVKVMNVGVTGGLVGYF